MELLAGQWKNLQSERVILAPGPPEETQTVNRIYDLFLDERLKLQEIANTINAMGIPTEYGRAWTCVSVRGILSNEKYIGNAVYNRTSKKLNARWHRNPEHEWIRCVGAFEPVVSKDKFDRARQRLFELARPLTETDLLDRLSALWCSRGHLNSLLVEKSRFTPCPDVYGRVFGSMANAFKRIGFRNRENIGRNAELRKEIVNDIVEQVRARGGRVTVSPWNKHLTINEEVRISVFISRQKSKGPRIWQFGYRSLRKPDIIVGARLADRGGPIVDYFLFPFLFVPHGSWITTSLTSGARLERFRVSNLVPLFDLLARGKLDAPQW